MDEIPKEIQNALKDMNWEDRLKKARAQREVVLRERAANASKTAISGTGKPAVTSIDVVEQLRFGSASDGEPGPKPKPKKPAKPKAIQLQDEAKPKSGPKTRPKVQTKKAARTQPVLQPIAEPEVVIPKTATSLWSDRRRLARIGLVFCGGIAVGAGVVAIQNQVLNRQPPAADFIAGAGPSFDGATLATDQVTQLSDERIQSVSVRPSVELSIAAAIFQPGVTNVPLLPKPNDETIQSTTPRFAAVQSDLDVLPTLSVSPPLPFGPTLQSVWAIELLVVEQDDAPFVSDVSIQKVPVLRNAVESKVTPAPDADELPQVGPPALAPAPRVSAAGPQQLLLGNGTAALTGSERAASDGTPAALSKRSSTNPWAEFEPELGGLARIAKVMPVIGSLVSASQPVDRTSPSRPEPYTGVRPLTVAAPRSGGGMTSVSYATNVPSTRESGIALSSAPVPGTAPLFDTAAPPPTSVIPGASDYILRIYAAANADLSVVTETRRKLSELGVPIRAVDSVGFLIRSNQVRFFDEGSEIFATRLADEIGGIARDFTRSGASPPAGTIEMYLAGAELPAPQARPVADVQVSPPPPSPPAAAPPSRRRPSAADRMRSSVISRVRSGLGR